MVKPSLAKETLWQALFAEMFSKEIFDCGNTTEEGVNIMM